MDRLGTSSVAPQKVLDAVAGVWALNRRGLTRRRGCVVSIGKRRAGLCLKIYLQVQAAFRYIDRHRFDIERRQWNLNHGRQICGRVG